MEQWHDGRARQSPEVYQASGLWARQFRTVEGPGTAVGGVKTGPSKITGRAAYASPNGRENLFFVHRLFDPDTIALRDRMLGVSKQLHWKAELVRELLLRFGRVGAEAEEHDVGLVELRLAVAKRTGFHRAAWCVRLGIEKQHDGLSAQSR